MLVEKKQDSWAQFLDFIEDRCSSAEFTNWLAPIKMVEESDDRITLEVPNIFVQEYLLTNYKRDLCTFLPLKDNGDPAITFVISEPIKEKNETKPQTLEPEAPVDDVAPKLNSQYTFQSFIEGPSNQFVKSAAMGVARKPGKSYNPLFIHGGVGLGKTHLLHGIAHYARANHKKIKIHYITTEGFVNDLVDNLRNKSIDRMKNFYRTLDLFLVDDIQFLRPNFEEEFCNTIEALINQNKQVVITSDKPPGQLKLSERLIARMEWGLVAHIGMPDLETRVAILQHKAEVKGLKLPNRVAFFIAEHIYNNVRQLEGAINRLTAYCRLMGLDVTEEVAEKTLSEMFQYTSHKQVSVDHVLKSVAAMFNVRVSDLKGTSRTKEIALPRQIAMYLAKELINDSLMKIASAFGGKTHSTLLHAWKKVREMLEEDENLRRRVQMTRRNIET